MAEIQPFRTLFNASKNSCLSQSYNHQTEKQISNIVVFYEGAILHTLQNHLRTICRLMGFRLVWSVLNCVKWEMSAFSLFLHVRCYLGNVISYLAVAFSFYQIRIGQTNKQENKKTNRNKRIIRLTRRPACTPIVANQSQLDGRNLTNWNSNAFYRIEKLLS